MKGEQWSGPCYRRGSGGFNLLRGAVRLSHAYTSQLHAEFAPEIIEAPGGRVFAEVETEVPEQRRGIGMHTRAVPFPPGTETVVRRILGQLGADAVEFDVLDAFLHGGGTLKDDTFKTVAPKNAPAAGRSGAVIPAGEPLLQVVHEATDVPQLCRQPLALW